MIDEANLPAIAIGLGAGLLLGLAAVYLFRRGLIGRLTLILLVPLLILVPPSWPLAAALSYGGRMEQLRCAFALVIPLAVGAWLLARVAGWDVEENAMLLPEMDFKARQRWAAENILESENLTADLSDQEAKKLLMWGIARAHQLAEDSALFPADEAQAILGQQLNALRKLLRGINKLAADGRPLEPERLRKRLDRLLTAAADLNWPTPTADTVDRYAAERQPLGAEQRLAQLMNLFTQADE